MKRLLVPVIVFTMFLGVSNNIHAKGKDAPGFALFNLQGKLIKTLVDELLPAGNYLSKWDGKNENHVQVSSGVYIYNLKVAYRQKSGKMTFLK